MINILGDAPPVQRLVTGLWSFDHAFENSKGEVGFPLGKGIEVYGPTNCGKSTIVYGLAGITATAQGKDIALADLEGFDPNFLTTVLTNAGFAGNVQYIARDDDEEVLDTLVVFLRNKAYSVGILDSIGAVSPISEQEGAIGEANMGRRAKIMAQFTRKCLKILRQPDAPTIFMINHVYPRIGGLGSSTPGGEVKRYLVTIQIQVKRRFYKGKYEEYPDGSYLIEGTVTKNRWGYKDRKFLLFVLSGKGIHKGMTAVFDGIELGLVDRKKVISIGDTKFGYLKNLVEQAQAGNDAFFEPFFELLRGANAKLENIESEEEDGQEDTTD